MSRINKLIRDEDLVAEVAVELGDADEPWGPTISLDDAKKIDEVREAMRQRDYEKVRAVGRLYRLVPIDTQPNDPQAA